MSLKQVIVMAVASFVDCLQCYVAFGWVSWRAFWLESITLPMTASYREAAAIAHTFFHQNGIAQNTWSSSEFHLHFVCCKCIGSVIYLFMAVSTCLHQSRGHFALHAAQYSVLWL